MGLETLKITGLESKRYAVRERVAPVVGEEPYVGAPLFSELEPDIKRIDQS